MKNYSFLFLLTLILGGLQIGHAQQNYVKRVNCGDTNATTHNGETFDADNQNGYTFIGDNKSTTGHSNFTLKTNPGEIYARTRYTKLTTSMQYAFPVQDGQYEVILHWAEPYHGPGLSGQAVDYRQFDVQINGGALEENNLCVFCEVGINATLVRTYQVTASGGNGITIDFIDQNKNDPIINAIEVLGIDTSDNQNPTAPTLSSSGVTTSSVDLNWSGASDNIGVTNYKVYKEGALEASLGNVTTYQVTGLSEGTSYGFTVRALDAAGNESAASNIETITTSSTGGGGTVWNQSGSNINYTSGNVGIRSSAQSNYALAVGGKIISEEVKVQLQNSWPDYVFKDSYQLPSLAEVKEHIAKKGHLINMPSAEEVTNTGIELGEMNRLLVEKIEELTLYILNQEKRLEELGHDNNALKSRLKKLESVTKN